MQVPNIKLSIMTQKAANKILSVSRNSKLLSIGEQTKLANYYAYLISTAKNDDRNFARIMCNR